ncbi:MAG: hypothetical protein ACREEM_20055, partial [Blastocatellia bacterium]
TVEGRSQVSAVWGKANLKLNRVPLLNVTEGLFSTRLVQLLAGTDKFFNPSAGWAEAARAHGWTISGDGHTAELPRPTHYVSAWPQDAHTVRGQTTTVFAMMDQPAIREPSCIVSLAGRPARAACLTAEETSVGFEVQDLQSFINRQASETVLRLSNRIQPGR